MATYTLDLTGDDHKVRMPTALPGRSFTDRFTARFNHRYMGKAVLVNAALDTCTTYPGIDQTIGGGDYATDENDINTAAFVFYGGETYTLDDSVTAEASAITLLNAAGYTLT